MVWEAHKGTIRGVLIAMGSRRKKEKEANIKKLTTQINRLERLHKQSLSTDSAIKLLDARKELQQILDSRAKHMLFFQKIYILRIREQGQKTAGKSVTCTYL